MFGLFFVYDNRSKGYRIYTENGRVIFARIVKFIKNKISNSNGRIEEILSLHEKNLDRSKHTQSNGKNQFELDLTPTQSEHPLPNNQHLNLDDRKEQTRTFHQSD